MTVTAPRYQRKVHLWGTRWREEHCDTSRWKVKGSPAAVPRFPLSECNWSGLFSTAVVRLLPRRAAHTDLSRSGAGPSGLQDPSAAAAGGTERATRAEAASWGTAGRGLHGAADSTEGWTVPEAAEGGSKTSRGAGAVTDGPALLHLLQPWHSSSLSPGRSKPTGAASGGGTGAQDEETVQRSSADEGDKSERTATGPDL